MSLITCSPGNSVFSLVFFVLSMYFDDIGAWLPFQDPKAEEDRLIVVMKERVNGEEFHQELLATDYEKKESNLRRILKNGFYDLDVCLNTWHAWVQWRHG
jgi:hypothetical protein